jgi:acetyl-CoA carboxylase biotin carboxyl carrier protein
MKRSELTEFAVEEEGFKLKIRRDLNGAPVVTTNGASTVPFQAGRETPANNTGIVGGAGNVAGLPLTVGEKEEPGITYVKAPMVGTFYRAPSPESPPFVEVDAKVADNSVVCIIEAMKIMNEIQAETKGIVVEVLVENGQPVEYGQRLFKIKQG